MSAHFFFSELRQVYAAAVPPKMARQSQGWPFSVLVAVGVPNLLALTCYEQIIDQENHAKMGGVNPGRRLEHFQNIVAMLEAFERSARGGLHGRAPNKAFEEVRISS